MHRFDLARPNTKPEPDFRPPLTVRAMFISKKKFDEGIYHEMA